MPSATPENRSWMSSLTGGETESAGPKTAFPGGTAQTNTVERGRIIFRDEVGCSQPPSRGVRLPPPWEARLMRRRGESRKREKQIFLPVLHCRRALSRRRGGLISPCPAGHQSHRSGSFLSSIPRSASPP